MIRDRADGDQPGRHQAGIEQGGGEQAAGHFADRLVAKVLARQSHVVVGLDPRLDLLPAHLVNRCRKEFGSTHQAAAMAIFEFNRQIIDAVADLAPAVKPQMAFYEEYGAAGIEALHLTVNYAKRKGLLVILDGKRNDIGSTAEAYARAYLGGDGETAIGSHATQAGGADAVTVNAYLGEDGVEPFISYGPEKGTFILVKTSNPSSGQLQDLFVGPGEHPAQHLRPLYEVVAGLVDQWGRDLVGKSGYSSVGAVVGATYPEVARRLRDIMPRAYFLVPGFGAQGATAADAAAAFNDDGLGALVNVSRAVIYAYRNNPGYNTANHDGAGEVDFAAAARKAVQEINRQINHEVNKKRLK